MKHFILASVLTLAGTPAFASTLQYSGQNGGAFCDVKADVNPASMTLTVDGVQADVDLSVSPQYRENGKAFYQAGSVTVAISVNDLGELESVQILEGEKLLRTCSGLLKLAPSNH